MKQHRVKAILRNRKFTPVPSELGCLVQVNEVAKTVLVTNDPAELTPGEGVLLKNEDSGKGERIVLCRFDGDEEDTTIIASFSEVE